MQPVVDVAMVASGADPGATLAGRKESLMHGRVTIPIVVAVVFSTKVGAVSTYDNWPDIDGMYFGQAPPGIESLRGGY